MFSGDTSLYHVGINKDIIIWNAEINSYVTVYLHLCFLSAIPVLIHLIFIGTETPQHDRKVFEGAFECNFFA